MQWYTWGQWALLALTLAGACGGTKSSAPAMAEGTKMKDGDALEVGVAQVDAVLHARVLAQGESLAVRLLGTVGPDGSWSLAEIAVEEIPGGVRLTPVVHHRPGGMVIQMLIPLDEKILVPLPEGTPRLEVLGRDSTFVESIRVGSGAKRLPPDTHLAYQVVSSGLRSLDFVVFETFPGDGFVEAIEYRETRADGTGPWQILPGCQREGARLRGRIQVNPGGDVLRIEARALSGQGDVDPEPALLNLQEEP